MVAVPKLIKTNIPELFIHIFEKTTVVILIVCGIMYNGPGFEVYRLKFFIVSGLVAGFYNGLFNDYIWRNKKDGKTTRLSNYPIPYLVHTIFNHVVGGLIGAVSLYFLLNDIDIYQPQRTISNLGVSDLVLFLITVTSYFGLLPRTLWYGSYGPTLGGKG